MSDFFSSFNFYFVLASLAIIIPIIYGFISDYKRDHKILVSIAIVCIMLITLYYIAQFVSTLF